MSGKTSGQAAHKLPKIHAHPDDLAEEWLAGEFEPDDSPVGVSYDRENMIDAFRAGWDQARELTAAAQEPRAAPLAPDDTWRNAPDAIPANPQAAPELAAAMAERDDLHARHRAAMQMLAEVQEERDHLRAERDQLREQLAAADRAIAEFRRQCSELAGELGAARGALRQIDGYAVGKGLEAGALADIRAIARNVLDGDAREQSEPRPAAELAAAMAETRGMREKLTAEAHRLDAAAAKAEKARDGSRDGTYRMMLDQRAEWCREQAAALRGIAGIEAGQ